MTDETPIAVQRRLRDLRCIWTPLNWAEGNLHGWRICYARNDAVTMVRCLRIHELRHTRSKAREYLGSPYGRRMQFQSALGPESDVESETALPS